MSELENTNGSTGTTGNTPSGSSSYINLAIESVMDMIDALSLFASITRGALGTKQGLCCEVAPSYQLEVYCDKNQYIPIDLTINGKHNNLQTLTDALNTITDSLSRKTEYTKGNGWQIVDITIGTLPQVIGRDENGIWIMACNIIVKIFRKDDETNG